jgi:glycosyltransferase involved in cell wall biosynthesis
LRGLDYVLFAVDDTVFVQDFTMADMAGTLDRRQEVLGFSLRMGRNTTYCYTMNHAQKLPEFEPLEEGSLKYRWRDADHDFGYPLELSSSVYRIKDILPLLEQLEFTNPNTLEDIMSHSTERFRESHPFLACREHSGAFSIPANKVQEVCDNRAGGSAAYSAESLAALFARGQRIQTQSFDGFIPEACHQEVELKTAPEAEPVPLVTVIMPCYNQARYLPEAVASVVAQAFADWEIIIVNDGSQDDTCAVARQLVKKYEGRRIRLLEKKNGGLAHARNAGIRAAAGAYILPLDADDRIEPAMLEKTVALLEENPRIAIAYTDVAHFGAAEKTIRAAEFDFKGICVNNQLNYCSLFRREAWELAGGYNSNLVWGYEDWDLWIGCGEQGLVARRIPEALLQYRVKDTSMYTGALARDRELRARIVLNHPALYDAEKLIEARAVWGNPALPPPPGAPKVSVIVPTFNRPERLEETLRSIVGQTLQDLEIIVVNDNGLDVAPVVARCEAKGEIVYLRHTANQGLAAARNTGLRHARGRYIAYLDDDDIFLPDHLQTLAGFLESSGNKAAYTDAWCAEEELAEGHYKVFRREVRYSADWDNDGILVQNLAPVLCFMHERSIGIAAGEFDEQLTTHEDWDYWIRLSRLCTPVHIKKVTCEFRLRKDGSSMTSGRRADFLRTIRMVYKKHRACAAGNETLLKQQQRFLRGLEEELGAPRKTWFGPWFAATLRRIFRRQEQ